MTHVRGRGRGRGRGPRWPSALRRPAPPRRRDRVPTDEEHTALVVTDEVGKVLDDQRNAKSVNVVDNVDKLTEVRFQIADGTSLRIAGATSRQRLEGSSSAPVSASRQGHQNPARQEQGPAEPPVRGAGPSDPRAGTVTPLSVRALTGGDVGTRRNVRPSSAWQTTTVVSTRRSMQILYM